MGTFKTFGGYEIIEILQLSVIFFLCSLLASFIINLIFGSIDKSINKREGDKSVIIFVETFFQLVITAIAYFYIEKIIYLFPSIASKLNKNYESFKSANYAIHIVLIILLVELNSSLKNGIHYISSKIDIINKH